MMDIVKKGMRINMPNKKELNQHYGKYFELCVATHLNQAKELPSYKWEEYIPQSDRLLLFQEAISVANYIGIQPCIYTGDKTSKASGDIVLSNTGEIIEIKRVSKSKGTYYNPSQSSLLDYGFDLHEYMDKYYLYNALEDTFGDGYKISRKNWSPITQDDSSAIRAIWTDIWEANIVPIDKTMRYHLTQDVKTYFKTHPTDFKNFVINMITKHSNTSRKRYPDKIIVFNYCTNSIETIDVLELLTNEIVDDTIEMQDSDSQFSFNIKNFRFTISWQNGIGLNNPTIRVYIR